MKKTSGKGVVRARKGFTKLISDEDMNKIIKIKKSLKHSSVLIDAVTEPVKLELKKTRRQIFWSFVSTFSRFISATVILSIVKVEELEEQEEDT